MTSPIDLLAELALIEEVQRRMGDEAWTLDRARDASSHDSLIAYQIFCRDEQTKVVVVTNKNLFDEGFCAPASSFLVVWHTKRNDAALSTTLPIFVSPNWPLKDA